MYVIMIRTGRGWRPMNQPRSSEPRTFATQHAYATDRCPHKAPRRMGETRATVRAAITLSEQLNERY